MVKCEFCRKQAPVELCANIGSIENPLYIEKSCALKQADYLRARSCGMEIGDVYKEKKTGRVGKITLAENHCFALTDEIGTRIFSDFEKWRFEKQ